MSLTSIGALIVIEPEKAKSEIAKAIINAKGKREEAAAALGSNIRTLYRWIERLELWDKLDKDALKHGYEVLPGAPRARPKILAALLEANGNIPRAARALGRSESSLREKLEELDLYDDANKALAAAGCNVTIARAS